MWVFTYKKALNSYISRYRLRLVIRGDLQDKATVLLTYAATLVLKSFRLAMALAAHFDLEIRQFDVINVFINIVRTKDSPLVLC